MDPVFLEITTANGPVRVELTSEPLTIGRQIGNRAVLDDVEASRFHCVVERVAGGGFRVRDLGSRNGTKVNGVRVHHLRINETIQDAIVDRSGKPTGETRPLTMVRDVYVSTDTDLPVRVTDHAEGIAGSESSVDFTTAERLPLNDANAALLRMSSHPGAHEVDEGPVR